MTQSKHTPAPWTTSKAKFPDNTGGFDIAIAHEDHIIAEVYQHTGFKDKHEKEFFAQPVEANARLIASAPELLDALENAVKAFKTMEGNMNSEEWKKYSGLIMDGIDKARPAISKAKGE